MTDVTAIYKAIALFRDKIRIGKSRPESSTREDMIYRVSETHLRFFRRSYKN